MAVPYLNLTENIHKSGKYPKNYSVLKPIRPILFSIFLYLTIFCVFRFSHSTLMCTGTRFWFFAANTLILMIIAADFDAFTSSEKQQIENNTRSTSAYIIMETTSSLMSPPDYKKYDDTVSSDDEDYDYQKRPEATEKEIENGVIKQEDGRSTENYPEDELSEEKLKDLNQINEGESVEELNARVEEFIRRIHRQIRLPVDHNHLNPI